MKKTKFRGDYKTHRDYYDRGLDSSHSNSTLRSGSKTIREFLKRMKDKDDIAKKRIFNLRKDKAYKGKEIT